MTAVACFRSLLALCRRMLGIVADVTQILNAIEQGDPHASAELLPFVYDELRKLAAAHLADEKPGQTLQPTALVHEAYVRLVGGEQPQDWNGRGHFFAAAAEAMRRILVEAARRKAENGGGRQRADLDENRSPLTAPASTSRTQRPTTSPENPRAAELVKLRFFAGLTRDQRPRPWESPAAATRSGLRPGLVVER